MESGGGLIHYSGDGLTIEEATDWNLGTFLETQLTDYIAVKAAVGYTVYEPESTASVNESEFTAMYARLGVNHRVNQHLDYHLSGERSINFCFFGGTIDLYSAILEARWHLFQKLSLGTGFTFEHGAQLFVGQESFERYGPRLSLERPITAKMSGVLRYQYYQRQSDTVGGDYIVNILTLSLAYKL